MKTLLLCFSLIFVALVTALAQTRVPAFEMNQQLGRGINMGNCFEAPTETEWGNPWKPEYFKIISQLGFKHVRLPVRWETSERSLATAPYTINPLFLLRIQAVVDTALKYNLHIIINMHHHDALHENPAQQKERFLSQWNQIADYFKNYPDKLLFEILNEPHGNMTPELWNEYFTNALTEVRKTNPTRVVLLGVADFGGLGGIPKLQLPNDEYIILSPHYYNPFTFTHQGADWVDGASAWMGTKWYDIEADRETVVNEFNFAKQFSQSNHIPIHVGEFGAYSTADMESRARWTTFLARWFEDNAMSWAYWEFSAGFGIYNPTTKTLVTPLVNALVQNEMSSPTQTTNVSIYTSNFSNGNDGWTVNTQGGAAAAMSVASGKATVSITNAGTTAWHLQLVKNNILLQKNKLYRLSFKASASATRSLTFYASKASDPWNAYSGYNSASLTTTESAFTYTFTMIDPTDAAARLVFDLGTNKANVTLSEVKIEEVQFAVKPPVTVVTDVNAEEDITETYPVFTDQWLTINQASRYTHADVYNVQGRLIERITLHANTNHISLANMHEGFYLIRLVGATRSKTVKVMKKS